MSSARAVRCRLKCHNERNPCPQLPSVRLGTLWILPPQGVRKVGMTSNQHGPYVRGYTRVTMAHTESRPPATVKLKGIDGGPHKRRNMWFNSMIREEPYPGLKCA